MRYILYISMPEAIKKLIAEIWLLPGIWDHKATKLAFFLLKSNKNFLHNLSHSIGELHQNIWYCDICKSLTNKGQNICQVCKNSSRDKYLICVVEDYMDMLQIESSGVYQWVYHILWGAISPINGVFVWDLNFSSLFGRIENAEEKIELIIATNPNLEWEATSAYIKEQIQKRGLSYKVKITKLSRGLSSWYLEYADTMTLISALKERKEF